MIDYTNRLLPEEYVELRDAVGFTKISLEQAKRGIEHTSYLITARIEGKAVGMARVLFDFGYTAYIADVIVLPQYQGNGIGRHMVEALIQFVEENSSEGGYLMYALMAAKGKEEFYEKFGFQKRPSEKVGAGMVMTKNK